MPRNYKQGVYIPLHPEKWFSKKSTSTKIIYRSSWEYKFNVWADLNPKITKVASEEIHIEYFLNTDNKHHRYFPDYLIQYENKHKEIVTCLIEIKPRSQCIPPKRGRKKEKTFIKEVLEYTKNAAKWDAARIWCKERNIKFMILDEYSLGIKT